MAGAATQIGEVAALATAETEGVWLKIEHASPAPTVFTVELKRTHEPRTHATEERAGKIEAYQLAGFALRSRLGQREAQAYRAKRTIKNGISPERGDLIT